jgi:hypothetical protein
LPVEGRPKLSSRYITEEDMKNYKDMERILFLVCG